MMLKLLVSAVILGALSQGTLAAYCQEYKSSFGSYYSTYTYCRYGCCGTSYSRSCCSSSYTGLTYTYSYVATPTIAGAAVGGFIGLCVLIAIIVVIIKACTKSGSHGRVVQPAQAQYPMNTVSGTVQTHSAQPPLYNPPPYGAPPAMTYPPAGPAYPPPQAFQQHSTTVKVG